MLESIIEWILNGIGELFQLICTWFISAINVDIRALAEYFPALPQGYKIFQGIGLALTVIIAGFQIFKFFTPGERKDTPLRILAHAGLAICFIYFGGYILESIVDLAKIPFEIVNGLDAVDSPNIVTVMSDGWENFKGSFSGGSVNAGAAAISAAGELLLILVASLLIGYNILKVLLEFVKHYVLIGVLTYASPLIYPTYASETTKGIFNKYIGMFIGQCAALTIFAWSIKLTLSGLMYTGGGHLAFRMILVLSMCKVTQNIDSFMGQLGIGTASMGGGILEDLVVAGSMLGMGRRGSAGKGSKSEVLGANGTESTNYSTSRFGGVLGGISNAITNAKNKFANGATGVAVGKDLAADFTRGFTGGWNPMEKAQNAFKKIDERGGNPLLNRWKKVGVAAGIGAAAVTSGIVGGTAISFGKRAYRKLTGADSAQRIMTGAGMAKQAVQNSGANATNIENKAMKGAADYDSFVAPESTGYFSYDADTQEFSLDAQAQKAGLSIESGTDNEGETQKRIIGPADVVGDFIANNYSLKDEYDEIGEIFGNTIASSPMVARELLENDDFDFDGDDELGDLILTKAIGDKAKFFGDAEGKFTDIKARTDENGRRFIDFKAVSSERDIVNQDLHKTRQCTMFPSSYETGNKPMDGKFSQIAQGATGRMRQIDSADHSQAYTVKFDKARWEEDTSNKYRKFTKFYTSPQSPKESYSSPPKRNREKERKEA